MLRLTTRLLSSSIRLTTSSVSLPISTTTDSRFPSLHTLASASNTRAHSLRNTSFKNSQLALQSYLRFFFVASTSLLLLTSSSSTPLASTLASSVDLFDSPSSTCSSYIMSSTASASTECAPASSVSADPYPSIFISHGGGPGFFIDQSDLPPHFKEMGKGSAAHDWYLNFQKYLGLTKRPPKAIIVITAHWETSGKIHVSNKQHDELYYDYYGFPDHTYELKYNPPTDSKLADRIVSLLTNNNIPATADDKRKHDHGVFCPLLLFYPKADIPVIGMSIDSSLSPELHYRIGQSLAPLRDEDILIIGSGSTTHDLSFRLTPKQAKEFVTELTKIVTESSGDERQDKLLQWKKTLPHAKQCHPREEHFAPIWVVAGTAHQGKGKLLYERYAGALALAQYGFY